MSVTFQLVIGVGEDRIRDPEGHGPRIWLQVVPEVKAIKNRLHLDINASGGRTVPLETRRQQVDARAPWAPPSCAAGEDVSVSRL